MGLITALGLDWKSLVAQLINFAIIFLVLKKFAWQPQMNMLEKRQQEIISGVANAKQAEKSLVFANEEKEEILRKARGEAAEILAEARTVAKQTKAAAVGEAKMQTAQILADNEWRLEREKNSMLMEVQAQIADLVVLGVEKVTAQKVDKKSVETLYLQEGLKA
jgi:F-type H+-transporting ATPase subunit b